MAQKNLMFAVIPAALVAVRSKRHGLQCGARSVVAGLGHEIFENSYQ